MESCTRLAGRTRIESKQRTSHHRGERRGWSRMLMADAMLDPRRSSRAQIVYRHPATLFVSATTKEFRHPPPLPLNRTFSPRPLPPPSDDSSFGIIGCVSGLHLRRYRCYTPFGMLRNGRRPHLSLSLSSLRRLMDRHRARSVSTIWFLANVLSLCGREFFLPPLWEISRFWFWIRDRGSERREFLRPLFLIL